jgi:hypothetical protein
MILEVEHAACGIIFSKELPHVEVFKRQRCVGIHFRKFSSFNVIEPIHERRGQDGRDA